MRQAAAPCPQLKYGLTERHGTAIDASDPLRSSHGSCVARVSDARITPAKLFAAPKRMPPMKLGVTLIGEGPLYASPPPRVQSPQGSCRARRAVGAQANSWD